MHDVSRRGLKTGGKNDGKKWVSSNACEAEDVAV
jgi:hypothetical protein